MGVYGEEPVIRMSKLARVAALLGKGAMLAGVVAFMLLSLLGIVFFAGVWWFESSMQGSGAG